MYSVHIIILTLIKYNFLQQLTCQQNKYKLIVIELLVRRTNLRL